MIRFFILLISIFLTSGCRDSNKPADIQDHEEEQTQINDDIEPVALQEDTIIEGEKEQDDSSQRQQKKEIKRGFVILEDDIVLGNPDSKLLIIEYFSPTCPHCFLYHKKVFPKIKSQYIDTNKIAYVVRELIANKQDLDASILARCKGNVETYLRFVSVLLAEQDNWAFSKNYHEALGNIANLGGVSTEEFAACLKSDALIEQLIENTRLPVSIPSFVGTPSFFINGKHFTKPYIFKEFKKDIDKILSE